MISRMAPVALALCLAAGPAAAELQTAEQIDACYRANRPEKSSQQTVTMEAKDRIGALTESKAELFWQQDDDGLSSLMLRFERPSDMRGAGLLMIEKTGRNDMFIYLPELGRVKRVTSRMTSTPMFGTDFSYEDFERLQGMAEAAQKKRLADDSVGGRSVYVLELVPGPEQESSYERIVSYLDKETCVVLKSEFYERGEEARKILTVDPTKVSRVGKVWVPQEQLMRDLRDETETRILFEDVKVDLKIPRKYFSVKGLESGGR